MKVRFQLMREAAGAKAAVSAAAAELALERRRISELENSIIELRGDSLFSGYFYSFLNKTSDFYICS